MLLQSSEAALRRMLKTTEGLRRNIQCGEILNFSIQTKCRVFFLFRLRCDCRTCRAHFLPRNMSFLWMLGAVWANGTHQSPLLMTDFASSRGAAIFRGSSASLPHIFVHKLIIKKKAMYYLYSIAYGPPHPDGLSRYSVGRWVWR